MRRLSPVPLLILSATLAISLGCDEGGGDAPADPEPAEQAASQAEAPTPAAEQPPEPEGPPNPLGLPDDLSAALRRERRGGRGPRALNSRPRLAEGLPVRGQPTPQRAPQVYGPGASGGVPAAMGRPSASESRGTGGALGGGP